MNKSPLLLLLALIEAGCGRSAPPVSVTAAGAHGGQSASVAPAAPVLVAGKPVALPPAGQPVIGGPVTPTAPVPDAGQPVALPSAVQPPLGAPVAPLADASCLIPECAAAGRPDVIAEQAFAVRATDPVRTICLSRRAASLADVSGNSAVAGAAWFNAGNALASLGCYADAYRAYRFSLCRRTAAGAPPAVIDRVERACIGAFVDSGGTPPPRCEPGCPSEPESSTRPVAIGRDHHLEPPLLFGPGDVVGVGDDGVWALYRGFDGSTASRAPALRRSFSVGGTQLELLVFRTPSPLFVVLRTSGAERRVVGVVSEVQSVDSEIEVEVEVVDAERRALVRWSYEVWGAEQSGLSTTTIGVRVDRVWLVSEEMVPVD